MSVLKKKIRKMLLDYCDRNGYSKDGIDIHKVYYNKIYYGTVTQTLYSHCYKCIFCHHPEMDGIKQFAFYRVNEFPFDHDTIYKMALQALNKNL